ncbi:hypothetical protein GCM10025868_08430 [Angustibacter aerolatus]|uniref:RNA polymerase sigma-70 domain-containing protein n=1 Tax=Angustibacter aerolatus TaxID=1162965 RepID=A0ABQ6JDV7_9ACTN|nr:hypothetical protein GCM10025868_08430 [Angustibacter aerolatus]
MGIKVGDLHHIFSQVSYVNVVALDEPAQRRRREGRQGSRSATPSRTRVPRTRCWPSRARRRSTCSLAPSTSLPEREKIVVTLYYYEGLTLAEIGQVLGVTESRICQMHTKAVLRLRGKISEVTAG